jgi:hypothetical protein
MRTLALAATMLVPTIAVAGANRVYLVRALGECPGPSVCERTFESAYTFDTIVARTPAGKYTPTGKPSVVLDVRGVKDPSGAPFNGTLTLRVLSGRVSLASFGTLPDDSPLTQTAPVSVPVTNGKGHKAYSPDTGTPGGLITNGGGIEVLDPDGKRLAVTGSQTR